MTYLVFYVKNFFTRKKLNTYREYIPTHACKRKWYHFVLKTYLIYIDGPNFSTVNPIQFQKYYILHAEFYFGEFEGFDGTERLI